MKPSPVASHKLCLCGHERAYHSGASFRAAYPHGQAYWCCAGKMIMGGKCRCPRFRLAIAQPSDRERIENPHRP